MSVEPEVLVDLVTRDQDGGPGAGARYALAWTRDTLLRGPWSRVLLVTCGRLQKRGVLVRVVLGHVHGDT